MFIIVQNNRQHWYQLRPLEIHEGSLKMRSALPIQTFYFGSDCDSFPSNEKFLQLLAKRLNNVSSSFKPKLQQADNMPPFE